MRKHLKNKKKRELPDSVRMDRNKYSLSSSENVESEYMLTCQVNMQFMNDIYLFCQTDNDISACLYRKHVEMFKCDWEVQFTNPSNGGKLLPAFLNKPTMKRELQRFLTQCSDMLIMFNFFGYYVVKDIAQWIESDPSNLNNRLPFGIIPITSSSSSLTGGRCFNGTGGCNYGSFIVKNNILAHHQEIVFECNDDKLASIYDYKVFNRDAQFRSAFSEGFPVNPVNGSVIPITPFLQIYHDKLLITEAKICLMDANFNATHPQSFQTAKPLPDSKIDTLSEDAYFGMDSMLGAVQSDSVQKRLFAYNTAKELMGKINSRVDRNRGGPGTTREEDLIFNQRKCQFNRPTNTEAIHTIPDFVEISSPYQPVGLIDVNDMVREYENEICNAIRLPYALFKFNTAHSSNSSVMAGGNMQEEQINFYRTLLFEEILNIQLIFDDIMAPIFIDTYQVLNFIIMGKYHGRGRGEEEGGGERERKGSKVNSRTTGLSSAFNQHPLEVVDPTDSSAKMIEHQFHYTGKILKPPKNDEYTRSTSSSLSSSSDSDDEETYSMDQEPNKLERFKEIDDLLDKVKFHIQFNNVITKSNSHLVSLLPFYVAGVLSKEFLQENIFKIYGEDVHVKSGHYAPQKDPNKPNPSSSSSSTKK